ncbi:PD-(D/E)XK nuclease family protein [Halosegnis longus]|uniref:PD-(D/E)XK nuclease family protein n=1 Tax=Halosegnis longus TaxID=2216012 RepID=UPI00129D9950|nr:PD-(D/E)XK nuclease family protein [Halosegnis longus]
MSPTLHVATDPATALDAAFGDAASHAEPLPERVLYVTPSRDETDAARELWLEHGTPLQLQTTTFDRLVDQALERHAFETREHALSGEQRQRLVERAVDSLPAEHPLAASVPHAGAGVCQQAEDLLSLLEFAGLTEPATITTDARLAELPESILTALHELSTAFDRERTIAASDPTDRQTLRTERYERVIDDGELLAAALASTDAVVIGPQPFFSPLERRLLDAIMATETTVIATLPLSTAASEPTLAAPLTGVDQGASRAWRTYRQLGFHAKSATDTSGLASHLYRYRPETAAPSLATTGICWDTYPTPAHERRGVARRVRATLADGTDPAEVLIAASDPDACRTLYETCRSYGIPATVEQSCSGVDTELGTVLSLCLTIAEGEATLETVRQLAATPLTTPAQPLSGLAGSIRVDEDMLPAETRLDALPEILADATTVTTADAEANSSSSDGEESPASQLQAERAWLIECCASLTAAPETASETLATLCRQLGILSSTADWQLREVETRQPWVTTRERAAVRTLERVAATLDTSESDGALSDVLPRALETTTVEWTLGAESGVQICTYGETLLQSATHAFVVGLTADAFPSTPTRLAFTRAVNDVHPDFAATDTRQQARYALGILCAQMTEITLSHPDQTAEGDPTVIADLLAELKRIGTDVSPTKQRDGAQPPQTALDAQRVVGRALADTAIQEDGVEMAASAASQPPFADTPVGDRLQAGVTLATARQRPETTAYDGWISTETATALGVLDGPISPSRLDTFATCGFRYYMGELLGFEPPTERAQDPDARIGGTFIHNTLARVGKRLQDEPGEPIDFQASDGVADAMVAAAMAERADSAMAQFESPFSDGFLTRLLAGLEPNSRENPYAGPPGYRGVFVRLRDELVRDSGRLTTQPALFEATVGLDVRNGAVETPLSQEPVELIEGLSVRGKVDRVDIQPGDDGTEFVAVDYKTGSYPSIDEIRRGVSFQLPVYLRLLDATLDADWSPIGAAYYTLDAPTTAGYAGTPLAGADVAGWRGHSGMALPYTTGTDQLFAADATEGETLAEFLTTTLDERLAAIREALTAGVFHPTLLEADTAGCSHCDFAHVCDVRHHHRQARRDGVGDAPAYMPASDSSWT